MNEASQCQQQILRKNSLTRKDILHFTLALTTALYEDNNRLNDAMTILAVLQNLPDRDWYWSLLDNTRANLENKLTTEKYQAQLQSGDHKTVDELIRQISNTHQQ